MGRRVLANGKPVATTTSKHTARAIIPDMRLMGQAPVPRKNWIDSEHLQANRTTNTRFDGGWVWKQNTKCGEPPPSKAMPDDHLPGIKNGGFVDGCAEAFEGQGAPTVYVEGLKAICKGHFTYQNRRNTVGMIVNSEDIAAYLAEPMPGAGEEKKADRVGTKKLDTKTGDQGDDEDAREKDDDGNNVTTKPDATPTCTLESFEILDEKRKNNAKYVLEVISGSTIKLAAKGAFCADHAAMTFNGQVAKGKTAQFPTRGISVAQVALLHKWWKEVRVTCDAHGKQITGTVAVCSAMKWELAIGEDKDGVPMSREMAANRLSRKVLNLREKIKPYFKALERKLPFKVPFADFKYFEGSWFIAAEWKEQDDWQAWVEYGAGGKMLVLDAWLKWEVELDKWLIRATGPAVATALETLIWLLEWALDKDLSFVKLEIKFGGKLEGEMKGVLGVNRFSKVKYGAIEATGKAEIYLTITLKLDFFGKVEGYMGGKGSIAIEVGGKIKIYPAGALELSSEFKGFSLSFMAGLKIKIGWVGRFIPDWLERKAKQYLNAKFSSDDSEVTVEREWKLVDGWGKFEIFKTELNLP